MSQTPLDPRMQALLDKQEIADVLHRYCRAIDRHDVDLLRSVYFEDAIDNHGMYCGPIEGFAAYFVPGRRVWALATHHAISNILIELDGDVATVESYLDAFHRRQTRGGVVDDFLKCRYLDRFERRAGEWRIARRTVIYDWGKTEPAAERAWFTDLNGDFTFGSKGKSDPLYNAAWSQPVS